MSASAASASSLFSPAQEAQAAPPCACSHCGLPVPVSLRRDREKEQFCCAGCDTAWQVIHGCGLEDFYRLRASMGAGQKAQTTFGKYASWDAPEFLAAHARATGDGCLCADWVVEGIHCAACVWLLEKTPRLAPGLVSVRAGLRGRNLRVVWDPAQTRMSAIAKTLDTLGYPPHPARTNEAGKVRGREERRQLAALGAAGCIAGNVMMISLALYLGDFFRMEGDIRTLLRLISASLGLLALAWPGRVFFRSAWAAWRTRTPSLDLPIALGLLIGGVSGVVNTALGRGELWFDTIAMLTFLLLVGRYFRFRQQRQADEAVALMFSLTPSEVFRLTGEDAQQAEAVPIEALRAGDRLRVRAGERVPADGVVEQGQARVNQALMTGESDLLPAGPGSPLLAGSVVEGGSLVMRASACGGESRAGRLMAEVERAVGARAPVTDLTDRLAGRFVLFVLAAAAASFSFWTWRAGVWQGVECAVALLVIACPCGLGLATPLTFAASIGQLAGRNILVKGAGALDVLAKGGRMVLDKTGTLTQGRPAPVRTEGSEAALGLAAALEKHSTHPLAKAAVAAWGHLPQAQLPVAEVVETAGSGIEGQVGRHRVRVAAPMGEGSWQATCASYAKAGLTPVLIWVDGQVQAAVGFGDALRPDTAAAVAQLKALGWQVQMLSGDAPAVVARVAQALSIEVAQGGATPEAKQQVVAALKAGAQLPVVMVGDGVNDAAALAGADAGIAVHGGAEASLAAADVYMNSPGLQPLVALCQAARHTRQVLHWAWGVSLAYNLCFIALAAGGLLKPWMAAVLMPVSSLSVVLIAVGGHRRKKDLP